MSRRPIVLLDCDDVVANCSGKMLEEANKKTGLEVKEHELTKDWNFFKNVEHPDHPYLEEHVSTVMRSPGWCYSIEPFPGAVAGVKSVQEVADVYFITSPFGGPHWEYERREWLHKHLGILSKNILQGAAKFLVRGDLFVDDKPSNVISWVRHMPGQGRGVIWDRPFNKNVNDPAISARVHSWGDLLSYMHLLNL